jgi:hypothetical protein
MKFIMEFVVFLILVAVAFTAFRPHPQAGSDLSSDEAGRRKFKNSERSPRPRTDSKSHSTISDIFARKDESTRNDFDSQISFACSELEHGSKTEIEKAILELSAGSDSLQPFNTLSFYLFANSPKTAMGFLAMLLQDGSFPDEWIYSAVDSGIVLIAENDPSEAIKQSVGAKDILSTVLGRSRLIAKATSAALPEYASNVVEEIGNIEDSELLKSVVTQGLFWDFAVKTNSVEVLIKDLQSRNIELDDLSKRKLALTASKVKTYDDGLEIIRSSLGGSSIATSAFIKGWFDRDPNQTLQHILALPQGQRDKLVAENIAIIAKWDKVSASEWAQSIKDADLKKKVLNDIK